MTEEINSLKIAQKQNIFNFNSNFIYWEKVENHEEYKKYFIPKITNEYEYSKQINQTDLTTKYFLETNCFTSYCNKNSKIIYNNLVVDTIYPALDRLIEKMNLVAPSKSTIDNIWYNFYLKNGQHGVHIHKDMDISGIYLLKLEEPNNTIFHYIESGVLFKEQFSSKNIPEGYLILFPGHIPHEVKPCKKNKISISFNIKCFSEYS
jgi:hypothetical protein